MKWYCHSYIASWENLKLYPRNWSGKTKNPNFKYIGYIIRFGWWAFGIQKSNK